MGKTRVAILGGGLSGLVTAFNLTAPEQRGQYEVTLYQLGWRLGGKCATGRNPDFANRIQEHGLHVFMGQYDNAFAMVQSLCGEAAHPPFPDWRKAFTQQPSMSLMEQVDGEWIPWVVDLPVFPGKPGIDTPPSIFKRIEQMIEWMQHHVSTTHAAIFTGSDAARPSLWRWIVNALLRLLGRAVEDVGLELLRDALAVLNRLDPDPLTHGAADHSGLADVLHEARTWMGYRIGQAVAVNSELRRFWILADLGLSNLIGGLRDGLLLDPEANLVAVNRLDYKAWLMAHGADATTANSALVRALYDLIFAYPDGDWTGSGNVEAGTMFLSLTNTATYQGSIIWKFNTATGDLVMQPMYDVLKARGVNFQFFSRVDALVPDAAGTAIASVTIGRQAVLAGSDYDPLVTLAGGQRVWPDRPLYDQLQDGTALKASGANLESNWATWPDPLPPLILKAGQDFDLVVLAIPPGAHREICAGLIAQNANWQSFEGAIQTVATQSLQTWTTVGEEKLGWTDPAMVGGFDMSNLNSWADISEVLATEEWPASSGVVGEQIACGPMPCPAYPPPKADTAYPAQAQTQADVAAKAYLDGEVAVFWSKRFGRNGPREGTLASTYSRANIDPSERYTLSVTDTTRTRMRTCDSGYSNLYLTGDWIQNSQNLGSFEATTVSGMLASRAISGFPVTIKRVDAARYSTKLKDESSMAGLPKFVEHNGSATFAGGIALNRTKMWAFLLDADRDKLTAWCQAMFDTPSGGAVQVLPLTSHMMMTVVDIGQGRFIDADYMGWSQERELTFWIPAVRVEQQGARTIATHLDLTMPYLVLDNPVAIASGREIFGYFKQSGRIACPGDPGNPDGLTVDLFATKVFGRDSQEIYQRLLTMTLVAQRESKAMAVVDSFASGARALLGHMSEGHGEWHASMGLSIDIIGNLLQEKVPQLFLKQFRDVADGNQACYQAITEAMGQITRFNSAPHLTEYDMELTHLDSSPVAADFGIAPQQRVLGAEFEYDMSIFPGKVLWKA